MTVLVVYNPVSGRGRAEAAARGLSAELASGGIASRLIASRREDPAAWLRTELAGGAAVVVAGGDGAVRLVAREVARAALPLWHLPLGTENLFARAFGMAGEAGAILAALRAARVREIDVGLADCRGPRGSADIPAHFAIMASVGFDAEVVHALARTRSGGIRHASYIAPLLESLGSWKPADLAWEIDGEVESLGRGLVVVGNLSEYGVRLDPAPEALPDDRALDAVFIPASSPLAALAWIPLLRTGLHARHPDVRFRRGARIGLFASGPVRLQLDGDPAGDGAGHRELAFHVAPERLRVLLPADAPAR